MWLLLILTALLAAGFALVWGWEQAPALVVVAAIGSLVPLVRKVAQFASSDGEERVRRKDAVWRTIGLYIALSIALFVSVYIANAHQASERAQEQHRREQEQQRQELRQQGYVETGREVSASECEAKGGHVEGDFCLTP
jgi:NADH:ubiquinone oxidoreductase subunit 6 (subunit J)